MKNSVVKTIPEALTVGARAGLPDDLLDLLRAYPRETWSGNPGIAGLADMWLNNHKLFRELSTLLARATNELKEGKLAPETFLPLFERRMGLLLGHLEAHHNVEDHHYFPAFAGAVPKLQRGFDILDNDHEVIHGAIYNLGGASRELIAALSGGASGAADKSMRAADLLMKEITGFERTLLRHLDDEEDLVIPLILDRVRNDPEFG